MKLNFQNNVIRFTLKNILSKKMIEGKKYDF